MKIKTNELSGVQLDWAVAKIEGLQWATWRKDGWSNEWSMGGPIIERELIAIRFICEGRWESWWSGWPKSFQVVYGPTPLIAAMRCYVASKLGDEVEVPNEIV